MTTYNIKTRIAHGSSYTIHTNCSLDFVKDFMREMANGGYDQSGIDGDCDLEKLTAHHYSETEDGGCGDRQDFFVEEIPNDE